MSENNNNSVPDKYRGWVPETSARTQEEIDALNEILSKTGYEPVPELPSEILHPKPTTLPEFNDGRERPDWVDSDGKVKLFGSK